MKEWQVDIVAKVIYDQNPMRWVTYDLPPERCGEDEDGDPFYLTKTLMVPWERLKPESHARLQALRDAEKLIRTVEQALPAPA